MTTEEAKKLADAMLKEASALVGQARELGNEHRLGGLTFSLGDGRTRYEHESMPLTFVLEEDYYSDNPERTEMLWEPGGWVGSSYRC